MFFKKGDSVTLFFDVSHARVEEFDFYVGFFEGFFFEFELEDQVFDFGLGEMEFMVEVRVELFCGFDFAGTLDPGAVGGEVDCMLVGFVGREGTFDGFVKVVDYLVEGAETGSDGDDFFI